MDFATGNDFGIAVSKHLGLDPGLVTAVQLNTEFNTPFTVTVQHLVTRADLAAIAELMEPVVPAEPAHPAHPLREEYDSMAPHQRAHFGSFEAYCVMHVQLEEPIEESGSLLPEYVWLTRGQISDAQERGAISRDNGRYAIRVEDLTPEQKAGKP